MKPGIHTMSMAEYLKDPCPEPSLTSGIAHLLVERSPLHAWMAHPRLNPQYVSEEDTKFDIGTAAHSMLLEGEDIAVIVEADDWRTKAARELRDSLRAQGKLPLLAKHHAGVVAMVEKAREAWAANLDLHDYRQSVFNAELVLAWQDGSTWCRARPDLFSTDRKLIIDYKTTSGSAEPNAWMRTMLGNGHDMQAAHYARGAHLLTGVRPNFVFLVQETEPPYACSFVSMAPAFAQLADDKIAEALTGWQYCIKNNVWPGYPDRICYLETPAWAMNNWLEREQYSTRGPEPDDGHYAKLFGKDSFK